MAEFILISLGIGWIVFHPIETIGYIVFGAMTIVIVLLMVHYMLYPLIMSL